jgi:hypothetical protein
MNIKLIYDINQSVSSVIDKLIIQLKGFYIGRNKLLFLV